MLTTVLELKDKFASEQAIYCSNSGVREEVTGEIPQKMSLCIFNTYFTFWNGWLYLPFCTMSGDSPPFEGKGIRE